MPRRPRIHLAGVSLHSVQRGHNRDACFFGEDDYMAYPHGLGEALKESGCTPHAYVLMSNPVHWLLTPPQPPDVPRLISSLGRRSVRYINKTYHRTGTLWDSRHKSSRVQEDTY
jgi:putative transposase